MIAQCQTHYDLEILPRRADVPVVLGCDHASNYIPDLVGDYGLSPAQQADHIAWDPGAAPLTRALHDQLGAPAVLTQVSRLVIDPNRSPDDPLLIPEQSDGVELPANQGLSAADKRRRLSQYHAPYHAAVGAEMRQGNFGFIGVHSFTPRLAGGDPRPWDIGFLWNRDGRLAERLIAHCQAAGLMVGDNEPYDGKRFGYTMDRAGGRHGKPNIVVEVRQDLLQTPGQVTDWAVLLADGLREIFKESALWAIDDGLRLPHVLTDLPD